MVAEVKKYNVNVQEVHIAKVLVPLRDLSGPSNLGCKHFHMVVPQAFFSRWGG